MLLTYTVKPTGEEKSCQASVTDLAESAAAAALFLLVGTLDFGALPVNAHIGNQVE
jgi:hypothetical protein